jgi:uncharacterized protein YcaQ
MTLAQLRRYAISRTLFPPVKLPDAIDRLGFIQADPIRAPARAQDLTLRHRVAGYRAGDLERQYVALDLEEGVFINYGFMRREPYQLMFPRRIPGGWTATERRRARAILAFVRDRGIAHPRDVDAHFAHGTATNYWGGSSNATTHLLGEMHYFGMVRVIRRDAGIRVYAPAESAPPVDVAERRRRLDRLVDLMVHVYAPLPAASLAFVIRRLRYAAPQWVRDIDATLVRAKRRLASAVADGVTWYWPADEDPSLFDSRSSADVRLLSPFDPLVWDRRRFELFWGWAYRFEAYTPAPKRIRGYYALPLLWREQVIGWANVTANGSGFDCQTGFIGKPPRDAAFRSALEAELSRLRSCLG